MPAQIKTKICPGCHLKVPAHILVCTTIGCKYQFREEVIQNLREPKQLSFAFTA